MFQRVLVANRGEIALRVIRTLRRMGIEAVAVYSEADKASAHVRLADEAICIGPAPSAKSYLHIPGIIAAAEVADVDAIHPGYGFLAENDHFADVCRSCQIEFIGPPVKAMQLLGDKVAARKLAAETGVPTVPGSPGPVETDEQAMEIARKIGYPVLIKAAAGGGGRGMREAHNERALLAGIASARAEAEAAFGDGTVYVEKLVENPHHVEVQILADAHGNVIHLGERDCTVQRRHQKLIEESPSPIVDRRLRDDMTRAATKLIKAAGYTNAGTVEFLVDPRTRRFYFIEVNTRIQVEHPVTEMVTGIDIVREQIRVAAGLELGLRQKDVRFTGWALECRVNAEDPFNNFAPQPGKVEFWLPPVGSDVRVDSHVYSGYVIPSNYDSLMAKVIVHGENREAVITRMLGALDELIIDGIRTNVPFTREILSHVRFRSHNYDTGFAETLLMSDRRQA
ncbi:MAG TPA: acetyl-CoA carboxylase biotin carboxylase subunit [Planctomycetota bacterium]|nr:acetyl-CoA carboxylase biotin carboxylase subunit [Planctomycetota bacterium]